MEQVTDIPADVSARMDAVMGAVGAKAEPKAIAPSGLDADIDAALDAAVDNVPEKYRESAGLGKKAEKKEQPKAAKSERSEDGPAGDEGEAGAEPDKGAKSDAETNYALEKALAALRLDGVPSETIDAMLANEKGRSQLLSWGAKVSAKHATTAEKIQKTTEELKRAQESKAETTTKPAEAASPTSEVDFAKSLEAFNEYGPEFQKGQSEFARAIYQKARDDMTGEIQPAAAMLLEMRSLMEEMVGETLRREAGERFSDLVEGEKYGEVEAAFKRLWGKGGETYQDSAKTFLGRVRACQTDACQLVASKTPAPRKDDSQTKVQRIPASPGRVQPKRALTVDQQVDAAIEESMKRFAER